MSVKGFDSQRNRSKHLGWSLQTVLPNPRLKMKRQHAGPDRHATLVTNCFPDDSWDELPVKSQRKPKFASSFCRTLKKLPRPKMSVVQLNQREPNTEQSCVVDPSGDCYQHRPVSKLSKLLPIQDPF